MGTIQKQPGDLLAGNATLLNQLEQGIFHFDVQELLQFVGEVALGSRVDEGFQGRDQIAPAREPDRLKRPKTLRIKLGDLGEGVIPESGVKTSMRALEPLRRRAPSWVSECGHHGVRQSIIPGATLGK